MVYELMRVTLVLCVVVGPVLFVAQIFLMRIRRNSEKRLTHMYSSLQLHIDLPAGRLPPVQRDVAHRAPQSPRLPDGDFFLPSMNSALK